MAQNIVWITLESTRYDHTSMSGYHRDTTPEIDDFAADPRSTSFDHCITHGKWTGTSTASMLTGTHPPEHGIYGAEDSVLSDDVKTVPELLPDAYTSLSVVSNPNAGAAKGFDRGFDRHVGVYPSTVLESVGLRTALKSIPRVWTHGGGLTTDLDRHKGLSTYMMVDVAKRLISQQADPYFMYLHFNSSHHPYLPPKSFRDRFIDDISATSSEALDTAQSSYDDIHELIAGGGLDGEALQAVIAMYDGVLSHLDHCVGHLVSEIRQSDEDTIIVITGDHGDLLGEYGLAGHKFVLHDGLIHVPLVTHGIEGIDGQRDNVVQHIDILRTLLSQVGIEDEQLAGLDLTTETREFAVTQRSGGNAQKNLEKTREFDPGYQLPQAHAGMLTAVRSKRFKLLHSDERTELFALPNEISDVKETYPGIYQDMKAYVVDWLDRHEGPSESTERSEELDPAIKEHLSDMGYLV